MWQALARRLAAGIGVVIAVITLTFVLLHAAPGDPARLMLGPSATEEQVEAARTTLGFDRPLPVQYAAWLGGFLSGNWGVSVAQGGGRPVREIIGEAVPYSLLLAGVSLALSYLVGVAIGMLQAAHSGRRLDTLLSVGSVVAFAVPGYWLALALVMVFTYLAGVLPGFGAAGLDADLLTGWDAVADRLRHAALPVITLTIIGAGGAARYARAALLEVRDQPFVRAVSAKGLAPARLWIAHVLRNALLPVVTLLGLSLPALFSGAVFVEAVFGWPGVGRVMVTAVAARDYPVVMATTTIFAVLVVAGNLLADVLQQWVDPRLRT